MQITDSERTLLLELLTFAEKELIAEIHHTDTRDYKVLLHRRLELLQSIKGKIERSLVLN